MASENPVLGGERDQMTKDVSEKRVTIGRLTKVTVINRARSHSGHMDLDTVKDESLEVTEGRRMS